MRNGNRVTAMQRARYADCSYRATTFPYRLHFHLAARFAEEVLILPISSSLGQAELEYVVHVVNAYESV